MWFDLVLRSFQANFALPLNSETVYFAMLGFNIQPLILVFAGGLLGASMAGVLNLGIGMALARLNLQATNPSFLRARHLVSRYAVWLLAIPGMPLLGPLTVMIAAIGVQWRRVVLALSIGLLLHYTLTAFLLKNTKLIHYLVSLAR
jgi:membrane protein YqaA with SNARE-associated domain